MSPALSTPPLPIAEPRAWDVGPIAPEPTTWSEEEYLAFDENILVEFSHGLVEFLPMPTMSHQGSLKSLMRQLDSFADANRLGFVIQCPFKVYIAPGKYREPDLVFMLREHADRMSEQFWDGADLVMEIVSPDGRKRDLEVKRREYAQAGISEYWIVDPQASSITVLKLDNANYVEHGVFGLGQTASSVLLAGFTSDVSAVFNAAKIASL